MAVRSLFVALVITGGCLLASHQKMAIEVQAALIFGKEWNFLNKVREQVRCRSKCGFIGTTEFKLPVSVSDYT